MELTTSWKEEGIEIGLKQGRDEGKQREVALVLRILTRRLGQIEPSIRQKIEQLPLEQIEQLGEDQSDFKSFADLAAWLQPKQA